MKIRSHEPESGIVSVTLFVGNALGVFAFTVVVVLVETSQYVGLLGVGV